MNLGGGAMFTMLLMLGACSSFQSVENSNTATNVDAGAALPPVSGVSDSAIKVTLDSSQVVMVRGTITTISVSVDRTVVGDILLAVENLPTCVSASTVVLPISENHAEMKINVSADCQQGAITDARVVGSLVASPTTRGQVALNGFVRGRPGELDTTFATQGILTLPYDNSRIAVDPVTSKIYVLTTSALLRYTADGIREDEFSVEYPKAVAAQGLFLRNDAFYVFQPGHTERRTRDGLLDLGFGNGTGFSDVLPQSLSSQTQGVNIPIRSDGSYVLTRRDMYRSSWKLNFFTPKGDVDTKIGTGGVVAGNMLNSWYRSFYEPNAFIFIGGDVPKTNTIARLRLPAGEFDAGFGTGGMVAMADTRLTNLVVDRNGYYTVSGLKEISSTFFMARLTPQGAFDPIFSPVNGDTPVTAVSMTLSRSGGYLLGATVASGDTTRCTMFRYDNLGNPDKTFGSGGRSELAALGCATNDLGGILTQQADGRILIGDYPILQRVWD